MNGDGERVDINEIELDGDDESHPVKMNEDTENLTEMSTDRSTVFDP